MEFENKPVPADPPANAEADRIRTDPSHPMNARYKAGDQAVHDHVWELRQRAYPGGKTIGGGEDIPAHINEPMNKELGIQSSPPAPARPNPPQAGGSEQAVDAPEIEWTQDKAESSLRMTMLLNGEDFDSVIRETGEGLAGLFNGAGVDPKLTVKFLEQVGHNPDFVLMGRQLISWLKGRGVV
jgi:hypothetical protein